ncbi:ABC transporter ATP-binding protein [Actinoplanes sp. M2I2]|uniref:ABC transporter ATP-binding protein n=1 Tax=Actinoplanes sp. M2I2 TaxID=1734444 RepID=UPI002020A6C5|nr:ABC transporter ATP-binding protein [Actinoplanes sp. M2I2]
MTHARLELNDLTVRFGGVTAIDGVSLRHDSGGVVGLLGANGAGKTTFVNVLSGIVRPAHGRARLDGYELTTLPAHRIARAGLARTFQNLRLFGSLTALEHLLTPYGARRRGRKAALALLADVGLTGTGERYPGELSYGEQRRLELARALALEPRVILLDEPLAGLPGSESDEMLDLFSRLRDSGTTLLLVEHDVPSVLRISDRVLVLDRGRLLADGPPAAVAADPGVRRAYLGDGDD